MSSFSATPTFTPRTNLTSLSPTSSSTFLMATSSPIPTALKVGAVSLTDGIRNMLSSGAQLPIAIVIVGLAFIWAAYKLYLYCMTLSHLQAQKAHAFALSRERVLHSEREAESAAGAATEVNFSEARTRGILSDEDIDNYDLHGISVMGGGKTSSSTGALPHWTLNKWMNPRGKRRGGSGVGGVTASSSSNSLNMAASNNSIGSASNSASSSPNGGSSSSLVSATTTTHVNTIQKQDGRGGGGGSARILAALGRGSVEATRAHHQQQQQEQEQQEQEQRGKATMTSYHQRDPPASLIVGRRGVQQQHSPPSRQQQQQQQQTLPFERNQISIQQPQSLPFERNQNSLGRVSPLAISSFRPTPSSARR